MTKIAIPKLAPATIKRIEHEYHNFFPLNITPYISVNRYGMLEFDSPETDVTLYGDLLEDWANHKILGKTRFVKFNANILRLGSIPNKPTWKLFATNEINTSVWALEDATFGFNSIDRWLRALPNKINGSLTMPKLASEDFTGFPGVITGKLHLDTTSIQSLTGLPRGLSSLIIGNAHRLSSLDGLYNGIQMLSLDSAFRGNLLPLFWLRPAATVQFYGNVKSNHVDLFLKYWRYNQSPFGVRRAEYIRAAVSAGHIHPREVLNSKPLP